MQWVWRAFRKKLATEAPKVWKQLSSTLRLDEYLERCGVLFSETGALGEHRATIVGEQPPPESSLQIHHLDREVDRSYAVRLREAHTHLGGRGLAYGVIEASHVRVDGTTGVHRSKSAFFPQNFCLHSVLEGNPKYAVPTLLLPSLPVRTTQPTGFLLTTPFHHNYFHWIVDILPRLALLDRVGIDPEVPIVVGPRLPSFAQQTLERCRRGRPILQLEPGVHRFERLFVPTRMSWEGDASPEVLDYWRKVGLAPPHGAAAGGRRLYVSRSDAPFRQVVNEQDVIAALSAQGFETVVPSGLSVAEQAKLFSSADIIAGAHGAAFANLVFARPGTCLVEVFQDGHFSPSYYWIAGRLKMKYGAMVAKPAPGSHLEVDVNGLLQLLDRLEGSPPTVSSRDDEARE